MPPREVTDPELLRRLNGGEKEVTDPRLLARLNEASGNGESAPSDNWDIAKSGATGVAKGVIGMAAGMNPLAAQIHHPLAPWLGRKFEQAFPETAERIKGYGEEAGRRLNQAIPGGTDVARAMFPGAQDVQHAVEGATGTQFYEPKTTAGRYAETVGEFVPGAALGPGGLIRKGAGALTGGVASEFAGQQTEGTRLEPWARFFGGLAGGHVGGEAGRVAGAGGERLANALAPNIGPDLQGVGRQGLNFASDLVGRSGLTDERIAQELQRLGPQGFLAEYGQNLKDAAGAIAARPGTGKEAVFQGVEQRAAASRQRVEDHVTEVAGPRYNMANVLKNSTESRAAEADPLYEAFRNTTVRPTATLAALEPQLEAAGALRDANRWMAIQGRPATQQFGRGQTGYTAEAYDLAKRALDSRIQTAITQGQNDHAFFLTGLKNRLVDAIDNHPDQNVAGVWRQARQAFAGHSEIMDARAQGQRVFDPRTRSDDLAQRYAAWSQPEQIAFHEGARDNIAMLMDHSVKGASDELKAGAFNRLIDPEGQRKLAMMYGQAGADRLTAAFRREWTFNDTANQVIKNSKTASRQAVDAMMTPDPSQTWIGWARGLQPHIRPGQLIPEGLEKMATSGQARKFEQKANEAAPLLMRQGEHAARTAQQLRQYREGGGGQSFSELWADRAPAGGRVSRKVAALARALLQTSPHTQ